MKISVAKRDLDAALTVVSSSMSGTDTELSSQFVFRPLAGTDGKAEVLTFSGRLSSSCPFVATVGDLDDDSDKAFTIEGERLKQWLRSVSDATLEFIYDSDEKVVTAKAPRGSQEFRSLDPKAFPYWDGLMEEVTVTSTIEAGRLADALSFSRQFVGDLKMESSSPQHCVTEIRQGSFLANDKKAGCEISVKGLENCTLRVFVKDIGPILKFLASFPSDEVVEILEHPRGFLLRRKDGAVFGESKYQAQFPTMSLPMHWDDEWWWELPRDELKSAIMFLESGSDKDDNRLFFSRVDNDSPIQLGMIATTGNLKTLDITPAEEGRGSKTKPDAVIPEFQLSVTCLQKVLSGSSGATLRFGVNTRKTSGFVRFREDRGDDKYLVVMAWLRK